MILKGRTAFVTGGSRGIGYAIAQKFSEYGMKVGIISEHEDNALSAASKLQNKGFQCAGYQCDVSDIKSVQAALEKTNGHFGSIDVIVNCAGILDIHKIQDMPVEFFDKVLAVNLKGTFLVIQQSIPYLEKSNAPRIINISSNAGRMGGYENGMAYTASKGGIIAITYGIARQLAKKGITVNCIAPGTIESDMTKVYDDAAKERIINRFPIGRLGKPEEIAEAACYFASEEAGFTTGAVLDINGGLFMG